jgi:hypothetical protein
MRGMVSAFTISMRVFKIDYTISGELKTEWVKGFGNIEVLRIVTNRMQPSIKSSFKLVKISIVTMKGV